MRILRPTIKKVTPRRALTIANGVFHHVMLTPSSVPLSAASRKTNENSNPNSLLSTPSLKSVQRLLNYAPAPKVIPATPSTELSKVSVPRKQRARSVKHTYAKRRRRSRVHIAAGLVFLYYCKSQGGDIAPSNRDGQDIAAKVPSMLASPFVTYEKYLSGAPTVEASLKRKAKMEEEKLGAKPSKRLKVDIGDWQQALKEASERLQTVPPYPTVVLPQTTTPRNPDEKGFGDWQKALTEASERLQNVPTYPTVLPRADGTKRRLVIKLPVAAVRKTVAGVKDQVKNLVHKVPVAAMKERVKNLSDKLPDVASVMRDQVENLVHKLPVNEVKDQVKNLTGKLTLAAVSSVQKLAENLQVASVEDIARRWTELPLPATYSHPILQQRENRNSDKKLRSPRQVGGLAV